MTKEELSKLQNKMGIGTLELSKKLGIEYSTFYRYLNGKLKIPRSIELALETIERNLLEDQKSNSPNTITLTINPSRRLKMNLEEFGERVKNLREKEGIAQKDFTDDFIKIGASYLSDIENGRKSNISLLSLKKIARRLGIKIEIIFDYREYNSKALNKL